MKCKATIFTAVLTTAGLTVLLQEASAAALYFEKAPVKTSSERTCLGFAANVAKDQNFKNVRKSGGEVAGEANGAYVAITCVARPGQQAIAVVMAVSDSFGVAKQVGHNAANKIKTVVCFDTPC